MKKNCWEFMRCGREPNGERAEELGVCPAATFTPADGFAGGKNGGRACVYISGTFCSGIAAGTHKDLSKNCVTCDFYKQLKLEHGVDMFALSFEDYIRKGKSRSTDPHRA